MRKLRFVEYAGEKVASDFFGAREGNCEAVEGGEDGEDFVVNPNQVHHGG